MEVQKTMNVSIEELQKEGLILTRAVFKAGTPFADGFPYEKVAECLDMANIRYALIGQKPTKELVFIADEFQLFKRAIRATFGRSCEFDYFVY